MAEATMSSEQKVFPWWVVLIEGIAAIIIGILLLVNPRITTAVIGSSLGSSISFVSSWTAGCGAGSCFLASSVS